MKLRMRETELALVTGGYGSLPKPDSKERKLIHYKKPNIAERKSIKGEKE